MFRPGVPHPFAIDAAMKADGYVIHIEGDLDLNQCPRLERALEDAESSEALRVLLDVEELTQIDAAGLHAILLASRRSASNGNRMRLTPGKGIVADMFHLTALDITLPFTPRERI